MNYTVPFIVAASVAAPALIFWILLLRRRTPIRRLTTILIVVGATVRLVFVFATPPFYAPDEQAHFNYVKYLYEQRSFPVQVSRTDAPSNDWEYYQPPLYYLLCLPLYAVTQVLFRAPPEVAMYVLRCVSIGCWAVTLAFALRLLRRLQLDDAVTCMVVAVLACLPSYAFLSSSINNDNLVTAIGAVLLFLLAASPLRWKPVVLGFVLGLALLTKLTAVVYAFALAALLAVAYFNRGLAFGRALALGSLSYAIAGAMWLPWGLRNLRLYGELTGEQRANIPFRWSSPPYAVRTIATYLSKSFWSVSGIYNNVEYLPQLGIAFGAIAAAGLVWRAFAAQPQEVALSPCCKQYLTAMAAAIALNFVLTARFGYLYNQGQGRFLFPLLIPIAVLMALGLQALAPRAPGERVPGLVAAFFSTYVISFAAYSLVVF